MFTEAQQRALVEIARGAVQGIVTGRRPQIAGIDVPGDLPGATGAFVTLKKRGELRGCIGTLARHRPRPGEIARVAVSAAREDPRFEPVRASELDDIDVEVSVLGPLEPIDPF